MTNEKPAIGAAFVALAIVVLVFAEGARLWYSGAFFAVPGAWILLDTIFRRPPASE